MNSDLSNKDIQAINQILMREIGVSQSQISREARIEEDLGADSLTKVEIIMKLEEQFGLIAPDESWDRISTVDELYEAVADLLSQQTHRRL